MVIAGSAKLSLGADEVAARWLRRAVENNRSSAIAHYLFAAALAHLARADEARAAALEGRAIDPGFYDLSLSPRSRQRQSRVPGAARARDRGLARGRRSGAMNHPPPGPRVAGSRGLDGCGRGLRRPSRSGSEMPDRRDKAQCARAHLGCIHGRSADATLSCPIRVESASPPEPYSPSAWRWSSGRRRRARA